MGKWVSIRLTEEQADMVHDHGQEKWKTISPSESLRRILAEYFSALGQRLPDQEVRWGGLRPGGGRPKKRKESQK